MLTPSSYMKKYTAWHAYVCDPPATTSRSCHCEVQKFCKSNFGAGAPLAFAAYMSRRGFSRVAVADEAPATTARCSRAGGLALLVSSALMLATSGLLAASVASDLQAVAPQQVEEPPPRRADSPPSPTHEEPPPLPPPPPEPPPPRPVSSFARPKPTAREESDDHLLVTETVISPSAYSVAPCTDASLALQRYETEFLLSCGCDGVL